ncbi:Hsp20/alpha crystallin family protein [Candidatus Woesearchaeota archaeon]|nr:MAG: Hsp20/alpha crystallin family protein [Candidatus Woesearchaeota archaeon]
MAARRSTLWDEFIRMQEEMDRLFETFFRGSPFFRRSSAGTPLLEGPSRRAETGIVESDYRQPLTDIWETDKEVVATVELPGVDKKDIQINATDDGIEIKVEKKDEKKEEKKGMFRLERVYSGFYRFIPLPANVNADKTAATYKNGVLELRVPKVKAKKGREIKVN